MTRRPLLSAVAFLLALTAVAAGLYALQQTLYRRPPVLDLTPSVDVPRAAPVASTTSTRPGTVPRVDPAWLRSTAAASGVSPTALNAYARAELMAPAGCGVGWTTLAGIGWVESQHGTLGGRTLRADGHSSTRILGPALDGGPGLRAVAATTETTRMHGDPRWDHAVGPMQFIPTTWEDWAADGDGDGAADPNDIDDAALAAARYLCAGGRDLRSAEGWTEAVLSYNHTRSYLDAVHAAATAYAGRT